MKVLTFKGNWAVESPKWRHGVAPFTFISCNLPVSAHKYWFADTYETEANVSKLTKLASSESLF